MTRNAFIRALVGIVGIFAIVQALEQLQYLTVVLGMEATTNFDHFSWHWGILAAVIVPVLLAGLGVMLLIAPPRFLFKHSAGESEAKEHTLPVRAMFQLAAVFSGVLVLSWALPKLVQLAINFSLVKDSVFLEDFIKHNWPTWVGYVLQVVLGVYLLVGAPHLVRWQIRKIEDLRTARALPED